VNAFSPHALLRTGQDLSRSACMAKGPPVRAGSLPIHSGFPRQETYGLAMQLRRAAVSIPANILEGFRRRGKQDMNIAEGSVEECRYYLILAQDLGYGDTANLATSLEEVSRLLNAYSAAILTSSSSDS
jgi:four helix bundle protein